MDDYNDNIGEQLDNYHHENFDKMSRVDFYNGMEEIAKTAKGYPLPNNTYNQVSQSEYDELYAAGMIIPDGLGVATIIMDDIYD